MAKLHEMQVADFCSSKRKLVQPCRTRWLSHCEALIAMKAELTAVYATLNYFASAKKDGTAVGILHLICSKCFLFFPLPAARCFRASKQAITTFSKRQISIFSHAISSFIMPKGT